MKSPEWFPRWWVLVSLVALASFAPAGAFSAEIDPVAGALLEKLGALHQKAVSFSVKVTTTIQTGPAGTPPRKMDSTIVAQKPGRFLLETKSDGTTVVLQSDGSVLVMLTDPPNQYLKNAAPKAVGVVLDHFAPGIGAFFAEDTKAEILKDVRKVTLVGEEKIGGAACQRLRFDQEGSVVDAWIEAGAAAFLRRMVIKMEDKYDTVLDVRFDDWKIDPKVDAKVFTFTPPPGAKESPQTAGRKEKANVPPIKIAPGATLTADFQKQHHAWAARVLIAPCAARVKDQPWGKAALAFVEKAVDDLGDSADRDIAAELSAEGKKVIAAGCDDPLVVYLTARIGYRVQNQWGPAKTDFESVVKTLTSDAAGSRALLCFVGKDLAVVSARGGYATTAIDRDLAEWTRAALTDGSYTSADDVVFLQHQLHRQWSGAFSRNFRALASIYAASGMPEWVRRTLNGYAEVKLGWAARGGSYADKVTEEGWKGFATHLAKAKADLAEAWKLRPDRPEAAAEMIPVAMADSDGEEVRMWFDRATAAQFDYIAAYQSVLWAYRPRWGGSHEKMLAFGRACRDTGRYDTDVPLQFMKAVNDVLSEVDDWREFYRSQPELVREIIAHDRALIAEPTRKSERSSHLSYLAVNAWMGGEFAAAAQALADLRGPLSSGAEAKLRDYHVNPGEMIADVALRAGKAAADFDKAETLFAKHQLSEASAAYLSAAKKADEKAAPLVRSRLAVVDFERALAGGDWVKLTPSAELLEWTVREGIWSADASGTLINKGTDDKGLILFRGRVGADYEVRGEFEIDAPEKCCRTLGVAVGYQEPAGEDWINCTVFQNGRTKPIATAFDTFYRGKAERKEVKLKLKNQFLVRSLGGRITYEVNGEKILEDYVPAKGSTVFENGQIGFASTKFCAKNTTKIRNLEVRRVKAQP